MSEAFRPSTSVEDAAATQAARLLYGPAFEAISQYVDILSSRGADWGLIGPRESGRLWQRHILNSVAPVALFPQRASVVDVGSGAGLPGIPLAVLRPDLRVTLLESLQRRVEFLNLAVAELGLGDRVQVVRERAEDHRERYGVVTSRAVAGLDRLAGWCAPLMERGGLMVAIKGERAEQELVDSAHVLRRLHLRAEVVNCRATPTADPTFVVRAQRA